MSEAPITVPELGDSIKVDDGKSEGPDEEGSILGLKVVCGQIEDFDPEGTGSRPYDLVAVHGLYGNRENTWSTDLPGGFGFDCLQNQFYTESHETVRILSFGYDNSDGSGSISTRSGIRDTARRLLDELVRLRKPTDADLFRPLFFMSHDFGGVIVKEALLLATLEYRKYRSIIKWTRLLVFIGGLHRSKSVQNLEDTVGYLLYASKTRPVGALKTIREMSRSIMEINASFINSKIPTLAQVVQLYSGKDDGAALVRQTPSACVDFALKFAVENEDWIFTWFSTDEIQFDKFTVRFDMPFEERYIYKVEHEKLPKDLGTYENLKSIITRVLESYFSPTQLGGEGAQALHTFQRLAAPAFPLETDFNDDHPFHWIVDHGTYQSWLSHIGSSILYVHGMAGSSFAMEHLFQSVHAHCITKDTTEPLLYFSFDKFDDRRNSILAMMNSLIAQVHSHNRALHDTASLQEEQMSFFHSWTEQEVFVIFRNFLTSLSHDGTFVFIDGIDQCDASKDKFLKDLATLVTYSEYPFKVIISSGSYCHGPVSPVLMEFPTIELDSHIYDPETLALELSSTVDRQVHELIQQIPYLSTFSLQIKQKLLSCGADEHLRELILHQIRSTQGRDLGPYFKNEEEQVSQTALDEVFTDIMSRIPPSAHVRARRILAWALFSFHPLTVWEVCSALSLYENGSDIHDFEFDNPVHQQLIDEIEDMFRGLLVVNGNRICMGHPEARGLFTAKEAWWDVSETAHAEIVTLCLQYLSLDNILAALEKDYHDPIDGLQEPPIYDAPLYDLTQYAVQYWVKHYHLIPSGERPREVVATFLKDKNATRSWSEAHWWLSNPMSRSNRGFLSILPILARFGLWEFVEEVLESSSTIDASLALMEAARNGHTEVVRELLSFGKYDVATSYQLLDAANSFYSEEIFTQIVNYVISTFEKFEWHPQTLLRAAQFGFLDVVKSLLENGAPINAEISLHMTPLFAACRGNHVEVVKLFIKYNADIEGLSQYGRTPLHAACVYGHAEVAKILVEAGADVNALDEDDDHSMDIACQWANHEVVRVLAKSGCELNGKLNDKEIRTPLTITADLQFFKCMEILLESGNDPEVHFSESTALRYAVEKSNLEMVKLLLKHGANPNNLSGGDPLMGISAYEGQFEIVKLLVEHKAVIDEPNSTGWTGMMKAAEMGHPKITEYLLDNGADINYRSKSGFTALLIAINNGHSNCAKLLVEKGADLYLATDVDWTPIGYAYDSPEITQLLMEKGVDGNALCNSYTPLYLAACNNFPEVVKILLSFKVDTEIMCTNSDWQFGYTPLDIAVHNRSLDVVRTLLDAGADANHRTTRGIFPLMTAVRGANDEMLRLLMEYRPNLEMKDLAGHSPLNMVTTITIAKILVNAGADLESRDNILNTPITNAAQKANLTMVEYFITKGVNLNPVGGKHGGPIHIACRWGHFHILERLVKAGADTNLVNPSTCGNPLQAAARFWDAENNRELQEKIIRYLLDEGKADVSVEGGMQGCALNAMCGWARPEMVKLMLDKGAKVSVLDEMGRGAPHFAAYQDPENLQLVLNAGADITVRDKMGRSALHWAVASGNLETVERIWESEKIMLDAKDGDDWTPLLWAARGSKRSQMPILEFLIEHGADVNAVGKGLERQWTAIQIARYHGTGDDVVEFLTTKSKEKIERDGKVWDESVHLSEKADSGSQNGTCDSCFIDMIGIRYRCNTCLDFDFCYKCYNSRHLTHNPEHTFREVGLEYPLVSEPDKDTTESSSDSDTDDDDDEDEEKQKAKGTSEGGSGLVPVNGVAGGSVREEEDSSDSDSDDDS